MSNQQRGFPFQVGNFEVHLLHGSDPRVAAAQVLRHAVFRVEMAGESVPEIAAPLRDVDRFDPFCRHLVVIDRVTRRVVGNYRLLSQVDALANGGFYSETEFNCSRLLDSVREGLVEVGRACIHRDYRGGRVLKALWDGIARYIEENNVTYLFGCGSLPGADPAVHTAALDLLYREHLAPEHLRVRALPERFVRMDLEPGSPRPVGPIRLPDLIERYRRAGTMFIGDGAVVDEVFNTTDFAVIVPTDGIVEQYHRLFRGRT